MEEIFKPDKKYFSKALWIQLTLSLLLILVPMVVHLIIVLVEGNMQVAFLIWLIGILLIILIWSISTPIVYLWIKNLSYTVYEDRVKISKGILTKTQQNIPFRAITDFALERTLYDRFLGIGSIKIQTAGQSHNPTGYEGKLGGLISYEKWHNDLRERIKVLHPVSEALAVKEPLKKDSHDLLNEILDELKEIRKNTARM